MKTLLVLGLVLLLLVVGLPIAMGMGDMGPCPSCSAPDASVAVAMCLAILAIGGLFMTPAFSGRISQCSKRTLVSSPSLASIDLRSTRS